MKTVYQVMFNKWQGKGWSGWFDCDEKIYLESENHPNKARRSFTVTDESDLGCYLPDAPITKE